MNDLIETNEPMYSNRFFKLADTMCFLVRNISIEEGILHKLITTEEELAAMFKADGNEPDHNHSMCCLRQQLFLYAEITFEFAYVSKYSDTNKEIYSTLIERNNIVEEQPYNYFWDNSDVKYDINQPLTYSYPNEWFAVLPAGVELVLNQLPEKQQKECLEQLIWEYLINTLPITIEGVNDEKA